MRTLHASTSFFAVFSLALAAGAQSAPPAPNPAPVAAPEAQPGAAPANPSPPGAAAAPSGAQPTPDVPAPPPSSTPEPSPPPAQSPAATDTTQTPGATTSAAPTSATMLGVNTPADKSDNESAGPTPDAWEDGHALGVELLFRGGSRIGSASVASDTEEKAGIGFDLGAWFRIARAYSLGLELRRMGLGNISFTSGASSVNADYTTTSLELGGRVYPFRWPGAELSLGLHVGLAWQHVSADGVHPSVNLEPPTVFECSDGAGPSFALGAEIGGALRLTRAFWLVGNVSGDGYQLTSETVGNCVSGIGSITAISVGLGVMYAFDLGREARVASAPAPTRF